MSWWNFGGILNPINDIYNIGMGAVHLVTEPSVQINKYIEPAVISALPAAAAVGGCIFSAGLGCAAAVAGAATVYGAQASQQGIGGLLGGKTPDIGDFAAGAAVAGGVYGAGTLLGYGSTAATTASTATSSSGDLLSTSGFNTAMANLGTTADSFGGATSGSFLGSVGSTLSGIGSTLGSGLTDTLDVLGTATKVLSIAATGMEAYSIISGNKAQIEQQQGQNSNATSGCNTAESQAQQFGSIAQTFNNDYQAVTASNAQQTLSTLKSLYSQANQLGSEIISSGSACVTSSVANQIQQTLSQMQTAISNLETALSKTSSASTTSSSTASASSTCTSYQNQFSSAVSQFNALASQTPSSEQYSQMQGLYQQAQSIGNAIQSNSTCGTSAVMSIVQNSLYGMGNDLQEVANALDSQGISASSIQPTMPSSSATSSSATTPSSTVSSILSSNPDILPIVIVGGTALVGGLIWYALS
jgi:hypothetical protein